VWCQTERQGSPIAKQGAVILNLCYLTDACCVVQYQQLLKEPGYEDYLKTKGANHVTGQPFLPLKYFLFGCKKL
jgi:hypothetical protein